MTISELLCQERLVQEELKTEIGKLKEQIEIDEIVQKELRRQITELSKPFRY